MKVITTLNDLETRKRNHREHKEGTEYHRDNKNPAGDFSRCLQMIYVSHISKNFCILLVLLIFTEIALGQTELTEPKIQNIDVPKGFNRVEISKNSFGNWLRNLPLKTENNIVYLHNGKRKWNQKAQFRVIKMDVGRRDLQQCADAVMRLKAEFHFQKKEFSKIAFNFTSGDKAKFSDWVKGSRPKVRGNKVSWHKTASLDSSYTNFRKYLNIVFTYAGSYSLSKELKTVENPKELEIGDVFIQGGFPGHAVIVVDKAENADGEIAFMIAQSYMPAQEIHILKNPRDRNSGAWFVVGSTKKLVTPEWVFEWSDLKRFRE